MQSSKYNKTYRAPYKGVFRPTNPQKYIGNANRIVYRSSWEKKVMIKLDTSPDIIKWSSDDDFIYIDMDNEIGTNHKILVD